MVFSSRQGKIKGRAFVYLALCPHAPGMALHDSLDDRQADARAFELILTV
jgi:hypothetical protein